MKLLKIQLKGATKNKVVVYKSKTQTTQVPYVNHKGEMSKREVFVLTIYNVTFNLYTLSGVFNKKQFEELAKSFNTGKDLDNYIKNKLMGKMVGYPFRKYLEKTFDDTDSLKLFLEDFKKRK